MNQLTADKITAHIGTYLDTGHPEAKFYIEHTVDFIKSLVVENERHQLALVYFGKALAKEQKDNL